MLPFVVLALLLFPLLPGPTFAQAVADPARDAAAASEPAPAPVPDGEPRGGDPGEAEDERAAEDEPKRTKARTALIEALVPWSLPHAAFDDPCVDTFARYPYADGRGYMRARSGLRAACPNGSAKAQRRVAAQLEVEGGYLNGQVLPLTAALNLQLPRRTEMNLRASLLHDVSDADVARATQAAAVFSWRFVQRTRAQLRAGIGGRYLDRGAPRGGVDVLLYGIDLFPGRRLVARMELHVGTLGRATFIEPRATLGVMVKRVELYGGGDFLAAYSPGATMRLGGAIVGVRTWL